MRQRDGAWSASRLTEKGCGEIRAGRGADGKRFVATIEPFHGNEVVVNPQGNGLWSEKRMVLDATLNQGHGLATADLLGMGCDQIVAGWREKNSDGKTGIRLYVPTPADGDT